MLTVYQLWQHKGYLSAHACSKMETCQSTMYWPQQHEHTCILLEELTPTVNNLSRCRHASSKIERCQSTTSAPCSARRTNNLSWCHHASSKTERCQPTTTANISQQHERTHVLLEDRSPPINHTTFSITNTAQVPLFA